MRPTTPTPTAAVTQKVQDPIALHMAHPESGTMSINATTPSTVSLSIFWPRFRMRSRWASAGT